MPGDLLRVAHPEGRAPRGARASISRASALLDDDERTRFLGLLRRIAESAREKRKPRKTSVSRGVSEFRLSGQCIFPGVPTSVRFPLK